MRNKIWVFRRIFRPLHIVLRYMGLRNSTALKFISILLFTFGLVAPVIGADAVAKVEAPQGTNPVVAGLAHHTPFTQLLFEETSGEEERVAKDHRLHHSFASYTAVQPGVIRIVSATNADGYTSSPIQKLRAHPPLFRLYRTFII